MIRLLTIYRIRITVYRLERLSFSKARIGVAKNPATPSDILARLSLDIDEAVRVAVANNTNTPQDILLRLAAEEN
ncbi:MAG: hypothetical protein ABFS56_14250 [Pseudomonadota bacterium]